VRYECALREYLASPDESGLARAHEIGRQALADGLGLFHIAGAHARTTAALLNTGRGGRQRAELLESVERFLVEALSPFEMAHRGFWEGNTALRRLNEMLDAQAKRIASALHDEAAQLLASVHLALADLSRSLSPPQVADIGAVRGLLDQIERRLRNLAHELRPPILEDLGLVGAVEFLSSGVSKRWQLPVSVELSIPQKLPAVIETALYRITQEALANVVKHAKATRVEISLKAASHRVACSIRDNGVGFDAVAQTARTGARGLGLLEIQERTAALGGSVRFVPNQPSGTTLTVEIPFER
jgi:signal transduction histidine kinase